MNIMQRLKTGYVVDIPDLDLEQEIISVHRTLIHQPSFLLGISD